MGWSPEQIAGRLRLEGTGHTVCHETIYRFIYRPRLRTEKLYRLLPRRSRNRSVPPQNRFEDCIIKHRKSWIHTSVSDILQHSQIPGNPANSEPSNFFTAD
jgi:IS30 family transposase